MMQHNHKSGLARSARSAVLLLAGSYLLLVIYTYFNQGAMLYLPDFPGSGHNATPADAGLEYRNVTLTTEDRLQLDAWYLPTPNERGVILFCHGNAGNISHRIGTLEILNNLGFSILVFDYRGYGRSEGKPDERGTYNDAEAAWQYLQQRGYRNDQIVIMGRSLGAAIAAELATHHSPGALVLESTFTTLPKMAAELYPYLPVRWLSRFHYETIDRLPSINTPLLILHSREDEIIPFSHGEQLFEIANPPKQFLELKGGHNDAIHASGIDYYQNGLNDFFIRYFDR